jgi:RecA-family ATPase
LPHGTRIAIAANGSVTLLSHPSLTGINTGTGLSGVTQWHNAFQARAYLTSVNPKEGEQPNKDLREIRFLKNQYGKCDDSLVLRWDRGIFRPVEGQTNLEKVAQETTAEDVFLDLIRRFTREGRNAGCASGRSYGPALFAKEDEAIKVGLKTKELEAAMRRLFAAGKIWNEPYGRPSRLQHRLAINA